ncbi:MAG: hypothetical protein EBR40_07855 [Proteobacteria bacterium]|nr:hypothetical protein [Pseudomonadota bacterium]
MKRFFQWAGVVVGSLILLLLVTAGSFIGWLKWSGERDWKRAEAELRAKGEKLTFAELVPPMPPDSENFFADPLWAGYSDLVRTNSRGCDGAERQTMALKVPADQLPIRRWQKVPLTAQESDQLAQLKISKPRDRSSAYRTLKSIFPSEKNADRKHEEAKAMLQLLTPAKENLSRIVELARRPQAQFPLHYNLLATEGSIPELLAETTENLVLSQLFLNRASSELLLGKSDEAATDAETMLRLSFTQQNEPLLISLLVRVSTTSLALKVLDQGLADHVWTGDQIALYQGLLEKIDLPKGLLFVLRGERIYGRESWKALQPPQQGFWASLGVQATRMLLEKNAAYHALLMQGALESMEHSLHESGWNRSNAQVFKEEQAALAHHPLHRMMYIMMTLAVPALDGAIEKTVECQTQVNQSLIACALERYRLAHGSYPASLDALTPEYLAKLPRSPINGKPMTYSLKPDGTFLLWTQSWNLQSLDGKPGEYRGEGEIVWGQPLPTKTKEASKQ